MPKINCSHHKCPLSKLVERERERERELVKLIKGESISKLS